MNKFIFTLLMLFSLTTYSYATLISGRIISEENSKPIQSAIVLIVETNKSISTNQNGDFSFNIENNLPLTLKIYSETFQTKTIKIVPNDYRDKSLEISLEPKNYLFKDLVVYSASKMAQKITQSPAAIYAENPEEIREAARTGQIAQAFQNDIGVDILQNGASDFIVNTRGFNGGLNRRVLVLQDGRDASMPLLGAQEWNSFSLPLDEFSRIEFVRGPSTALYGANAFNGVLNLTSYSPKEVLGAKASVLTGDYKTLRLDARYAGLLGEDFSYKISVGHSQRLNWSNRRDSVQFLEYQGLPLEKKTLTEDDRNTQSNYGTFRMDYDLSNSKQLTAELGYSRNTNEMFVFGLGRTFVKDVERPYARIAFNSSDLHFQAYYMQRHTLDTMWLMVPDAPLLDNSKDIFVEGQYNYVFNEKLNFVAGASQEFQFIRTYGTSIPFDVDANYTGIYGQVDYKANSYFDFITSARIDLASIHSTQFSPRFAVVFSPITNQKIRISAGRSFQRPNYSDLYRLTPDAPAFNPQTGKPVNFNAIQTQINDTLTALTGTNPNLNFGLNAMNAKAVGNANLTVEKNIGLELGYDGVFFDKFKISANLYYNQLSDFITNFLPRVNPDIPQWTPQLPQNLQQYTSLVENMIYNALSPRDRLRLSDYNGVPTFVVSNTNIGQVNQWGVELQLTYFLTNEMYLDLGYSNYNFDVVRANQYQQILPNTTPNKYQIGLSYEKKDMFDANINFSYTQGFDWLAGTYVGYVPAYALVNLNVGCYVIKNLDLGLNINNLLDRKHYEIFGGTYIPRYTTFRISYKI